MRICLVLEGSYPYVHGGVSTWMHGYLQAMQEHTFVLWVVGAKAADRGKFKEYLSQNGIHATSYWPVGPYINLEGHTDCAYIYDHVISIPCDQRYTAEDMAYICRVLKDF